MPLDHLEKAQIVARIERLQTLLKQLERVIASDAIQLRERAQHELDAAREALRTFHPGHG